MKVLLLTPVPNHLVDAITGTGDSYDVSMDEPKLWPADIDFAVSFGYRYIVPPAAINFLRGRIINVHISLLPWNRGADPNFWSWFDRTPKGVSIHAVDEGIDTGDVLAQAEVNFKPEDHTLHTSYAGVVHRAVELFNSEWPKLRRLDWEPIPVSGRGTYHRSSDKDRLMSRLPLGWDTPVRDVEDLGRAGMDN